MAVPNFSNRTLYHGDNLPVLRGMNSGTVDLIATDPPFNKGKDFHATPDSLAAGAKFQDRWSWDDDVEGEWVDQITDDWPHVMNVINGSKQSYGEDMGAFLCFMAVRLLEMRRVLKDTGSLYLHCDPTASHYLKELMDAIFGKRNFRNEIIWQRTSSHNRAKRWGPVHDAVLFYSAGPKYTWNRVLQPLAQTYVQKQYRHVDDHGRYRIGDLTGPGERQGDTGQPWRGIDPTVKGRHWELPPDRAQPDWFVFPDGYASMPARERLDVLDRQGLIHWPKTHGGIPAFKRYLTDRAGVAVQDVVTDINPVAASGGERLGYPTQKPIALYERIIRASSNEGDLVLDPFCGCATTPIAAERLERQWVGIDIWDGALDIVRQRMEDSRQLLTDIPTIHYETVPPVRTDGGDEAAPFIQVTERYAEPDGPRMSRAEMYDHLLAQHGQRCQGCDRTFDDPRYLELDHNTPRSDGGWNHITNRVLLCGPCNRAKSNTYTLSGLRRLNQRNGWMATS